MKLVDKLEIFKQKGWKIENNEIISHKGKVITGNKCSLKFEDGKIWIRKEQFLRYFNSESIPDVKSIKKYVKPPFTVAEGRYLVLGDDTYYCEFVNSEEAEYYSKKANEINSKNAAKNL